MKLRCLLVATLVIGGVATVLHAEESNIEVECLKTSAFFAPPDSPEYRKYVRDRTINVLNLAIDVTPDFTNRTIAGKTRIAFEPIAKPLTELSLDAVDLRVSSLKSSEKVLDYQVTQGELRGRPLGWVWLLGVEAHQHCPGAEVSADRQAIAGDDPQPLRGIEPQ